MGFTKRISGQLIGLFILALAPPCLAEPFTDLSDTAEDIEQRTKDAANVKALRRFLESKYVGTVHLGPGQNEPMREYINWLMEPLEGLVYKKQLMSRLRLKQVAGPTGVAKTQVARDFIEKVKQAGLIDPGRSHYQQGDGSKTMNLGRINDLQKLESELLRATPTNGYNDVRARHLQTYALLFFDESSHNALPTDDLAGDFSDKMRALKGRFDADRAAQLNKLPQPVEPVEGQFANHEDFKAAKSEYETKLIEFEIQRTLEIKPEDGTFEEAVHRLKLKYERDKADRGTLDATMHKIWQATSNGYWTESEEKGRTEEHADAIHKADQALVDFRAKHKQEPLLPKFEELYREIAPLRKEIEEASGKLNSVKADLTNVQGKFASFEPIPLDAIDGWLQANNRTLEAGRLSAGSGLPSFFEEMVREIHGNPAVIRPDQIGFEPGIPKQPPSPLSIRLRQLILENLQAQEKALETKRERTVNAIRRLRDSVESRRNSKIAFGRTQTEQGRPDEKGLLREYERLQEVYHGTIMNAADLPASREAIDEFVDKLKPESLKERFPAYYDRLVHLHNDPARYLASLRQSRDFGIKLAEILLMDVEEARRLIKKAVSEPGYLSRSYYLGNINVVMSFNIRELEEKVNERIIEIRRVHKRGPTLDEFAQIYKELVPHNWADEFMGMYFKKLFTKMMGGKEGQGNPIAERRRTEGGEGAIFIHPMTSAQTVTSVATTMVHEFERWKDSMKAKGLNVEGVNLFLHENVAPQFVRDDVTVEFGPNAILTPVRQSMGKLLTTLTDQVLKRFRANPTDAIEMNLALIDEVNRGELHNLTLRYLPPSFEQLTPILTEVPVLGKNSLIASVAHVARPSQAMRDLGYALEPVNTNVDVKRAVPLTQADQQKEELRVQEEIAELEQKRLRGIEAQAKKDADERERLELLAHEETSRQQRLENARARRKLENILASKPSRSQLEEFYLELPTQAKRDNMREYLLGLAENRRGKANMGHLYLWLEIDFENGIDVDAFVSRTVGAFKKRGGLSLASLLPNVVIDESTRDEVRKFATPGFINNLFRKTACGVGLGRLVHRKVPKEFRASIPRNRLFGGE